MTEVLDRAAAAAASPQREIDVDHRSLQRVLFRMQLDPGFAARVQARDTEALRSARLGAAELGLLDGLDLRAVEADPGGRRRSQFLRNVSSEFPLTLALARSDAAEGFTSSHAFHRAVSEDTSLPIAFGQYLAETLEGGDSLRAALLELESRLVRSRRAAAPEALAPGPARVVLVPEVQLARFPGGTFAAASAIRGALDRGRPATRPRTPLSTESETLLIHPQPLASPFQLRSVHVERLPPAVGELLAACRSPQSGPELQAYALDRGIDPAELAEVIESFRADAVLRGSLH